MRLIKELSEERLLDRIKKFNRIAGVSQRVLARRFHRIRSEVPEIVAWQGA